MPRLEWPLHIVRRVVIAVVVLAVVAVAVPLIVDRVQDSRERCADGVVKRGPAKECVGVSDGGFEFADHLAGVLAKIKAENDRVAAHADEEPYVSVAYMTSLTLTDDDSNSEESVRHELEGAYLAQYRHNRGDLAASPKIRLLVANTGSSAKQWQYTVDELIDRKSSKDRLVAVVGLGPSTDRTLAAVRRLSQHGLAMVASTMTATNIHDINGFVRVSPTNNDEAYAAAAYLKREHFRTAAVVQDVAKGNLYAETLAAAFTRAFPDKDGHRLVPPDKKTFNSSVSSAWENELSFIPGQLCDKKPQVVYFAGRGQHLTAFLNAIANRPCQEQEFTVMTGDDTTNLTAAQIKKAAETKVRVLYTGLAHPAMWSKDEYGVAAPSARAFQEGGLLARWFPNDPRDDGQAIMAHDSVLTAARGIWMAARGEKVTGEAVGRMFQQMDSEKVPGASGFLSFGNDGNPLDKAVPILSLDEDGRADFVEVSPAHGEPARR
ncbi:ABC transporter substrate-binding protein [Streptomyces palmae]|uniref:Branched-chain amino acid ABC transporter substrate-binding protein n=1 Tax=Streptomyces palmae TaxID=1701085 RepID=A0A4Z0HCZ3_9ACTN|nr:ABC transporter substrate-binding protein [Streptomyces palmae]TGB18062.1 branched-chain amino acid ABC transporter substrate-binding protein [Streptomyces palmae]